MTSLVVNNGKNLALKRILGGTANPAIYLGLGKSQNTPTSTTTALGQECTTGSEPGYARVIGTVTYNTSNRTALVEGVFNESNITSTTTIYEVGLFDASSGGTLFAIGKLDGISKNNSISIKIKATLGIN